MCRAVATTKRSISSVYASSTRGSSDRRVRQRPQHRPVLRRTPRPRPRSPRGPAPARRPCPVVPALGHLEQLPADPLHDPQHQVVPVPEVHVERRPRQPRPPHQVVDGQLPERLLPQQRLGRVHDLALSGLRRPPPPPPGRRPTCPPRSSHAQLRPHFGPARVRTCVRVRSNETMRPVWARPSALRVQSRRRRPAALVPRLLPRVLRRAGAMCTTSRAGVARQKRVARAHAARRPLPGGPSAASTAARPIRRVLDFDHVGEKRALVSALVACGAPHGPASTARSRAARSAARTATGA